MSTRRLICLVAALIALLSLSSAPLVAQEPAVTSTSLRVVDSNPLPGQELGLQTPITLFFNTPIDCSSAASAIALSPAVPGTISCSDSDSSVLFTPSQSYERATAYSLTVGASLRGSDGSALAESFSLEFNSLGDLVVSDVLPNDGSTDIAANATLTVIFNRPVVPLVTAEEAANLPDPLIIKPEVAGKGEWINTSIYMFRPDPGMSGGTSYTVAIDPALTAADGATLRDPFKWSFTTAAPMVVEVVPREMDTDILLDQTVQVRFNQRMDQASSEVSFYLRPIPMAEKVAGSFEWAEDGMGFRFTPAEPLLLNTIYEAGFTDGGALALGGGAPLQGLINWSFGTVPLPSITGTDPADQSSGVYPWGSMTIYFASPMDLDTLKDKITIEPKPWRDPDYYYSEWDNSYSVNFPMEPSTFYTVTIAPGMADVYGNVISTGRTVTFDTAPYEPDFMLNVPGPMGFYNARAESTRLFLTHRNISQLNLSLYRVGTSTFAAALAESSYDPGSSLLPPPSDLLRQWQMPVSAPLNARKYELLTLGGSGAAVECPGAPPSRLNVGDMAIVVSDPDPVRARANPPDGEVIDQLYKGYQLPIVGGPVCANNLLWWQVTLRDERSAWVAEAIVENGVDNYLIDLRMAGQSTPVEVSSTGSLAPGIYLLNVEAPETQARGYSPTSHLLVVATANLTMKVSADSVLVWATDAQSGQPIANTPVMVYGQGYNLLGQAVTDADGLARVAVPRLDNLFQQVLAVMDANGQYGLGYSDWSDGIEPYQFGQNTNYYPAQYASYLYTDRPIYRPDQPVYFRGVVRLQNDVTYTPPDFSTIPVHVIDPNGEVIFNTELSLTPFGTFSGQFDIADDAPLGYYRIEAVMPGSDESNYYRYMGSVTFGVAEFRLPEFQVTVTPSSDQVVQNSTIDLTVDSRYYFGGAVGGAKVNYNVVAEPFYFNYQGAGFYDFIDFDYDSGPSEFYGGGSESVASGEGVADAQGLFTVQIPAALKDNTQSQQFTIEATVTDESEQVVAGRTQVVVHKGQLYIGARPENYVGTAGQEALVNLIAVDWDSSPIANQAIEVETVERRWSSVQEKDEAGRTTWTWEVEEIPISSGSVTTGADGKAVFAFTPPNGGVFKVKIKTRDSAGNEVVAATTMWVSSGEYVSWRQQNSNRIDLISDRPDYQVGDTAEILIASPFQGTAEALITVERGGVLQAERVTLSSNSLIYRLPITEAFSPNVFVTVMLVKGVDENNPVAAFRAGMIELGVGNERKALNISITPDREQAGPRETVTYTVKTTDYQGNPVSAEVGVGLTDLASLSIADPNSGPILEHFYGLQGLSVRTSTPLTINVDQLTQTVLDTIKGGGGGSGEGGIFDIRQDFVDTAYWNAALVTDASGTATFEVTLPDNLTTWRLDARAVTTGADGLTLVGQNTFDLLSTKPLLIRPVTPRFFVVGDQVTLAAIVNNNTGSDMPVEVSVQGTGLVFTGENAQTFIIPASGRQRVEWPVVVEDTRSIDLTFFANGGDGQFTDASKPPLGQGDNRLLPVYRYEVPETVGTGGLLREGGSITEVISLPQRFDVTAGELSVKLEPSLAAATLDGLEYLKNYPHQCIEQTVSRFLPNIMTYRALDQLGVANEALRQNLDQAVNFALQRLYAQQKPDGGWGWFVQDDSDPLTTAYALIGLTEARDSGFAVSDDTIANAQTFLRGRLITPNQTQPAWRLNRQAFVLYALARSGAPDVSRAANLFEERGRLDLYAQAYLALAFAYINPADTSRSDTLISDLVNKVVISATGAHWQETSRDYYNWNSNTRTTAIVLDALVKLRPQSDLIPNVVRWLMVARTADAWETTQETAWSVMALTDWMQVTGELRPDYQYSVTLNGEALAQGSATPDSVRDVQRLTVAVADLLKDQANALAIGRTEGDGVLYYTAHLRVNLPVSEVEPLSRGITVSRVYTRPGSDTPVTEARVGELLQVRLTIIAPSDLHYVVIEDPIPAGTEGVNPNLNTEQQIGTQPGLDQSDPLSRGWGWWWFSNIEFRDEKVALYSSYLPAGTYEYVYTIRTGLAGTYNVIPPTGYEFYFPEVYGRGAGSVFTVLPS